MEIEKEGEMKRKIELPEINRKIVILIAILIFLAITIFFTFFYATKCKDADCFNSMLAKCKKAEFLNSKEDSTWLYAIKGTSKGNCVVNVKNVWIKLDEAKAVQGKSMLCYLPKGVVIAPESGLDECHGMLKEALQDIIIERMHTYIVQNIGQISESLKKPL